MPCEYTGNCIFTAKTARPPVPGCDNITALTAKMDAMQRAMDKLSVKAVEQQPQVCVMCGDERHAYKQHPLAQQDEESEQVNSLNSEPSFFPRPPFSRSYSDRKS